MKVKKEIVDFFHLLRKFGHYSELQVLWVGWDSILVLLGPFLSQANLRFAEMEAGVAIWLTVDGDDSEISRLVALIYILEHQPGEDVFGHLEAAFKMPLPVMPITGIDRCHLGRDIFEYYLCGIRNGGSIRGNDLDHITELEAACFLKEFAHLNDTPAQLGILGNPERGLFLYRLAIDNLLNGTGLPAFERSREL